MGNFMSCSFTTDQFGGGASTAKLIDLHGNLIRHVITPLTTAEVMLEEAGYMVSSADDIHQTKRLPAMKADQQLSPRKIYVLVPLSRLQTKVSVSELGLIISACKKKKKKTSTSSKKPKPRGSSKVLPTNVAMGVGDDGESMEVSAGDLTRDKNCRRQLRPSWTPSLETVSEE